MKCDRTYRGIQTFTVPRLRCSSPSCLIVLSATFWLKTSSCCWTLGHSVCAPMFYPCIDPWLLVHCILHVQSWLFCTKIIKRLTLQSTRWLSSWWGQSAQKGLTPFEIWYLAKWRKLQYFRKTNNDYFGNLMLCLRWFSLWLAPQVGFTQKLHLKFLNNQEILHGSAVNLQNSKRRLCSSPVVCSATSSSAAAGCWVFF